MAKRTNKYGLTYFEEGDITNSKYEMQRWETLDAQLSALFSIMGNGVLSGWNISAIKNDPFACAIFSGAGHVGFIAVKSEETKRLNLNPNSPNHIYAQLTSTSYWNQDVNFVSFVSPLNSDIENNLYLGFVKTNANGIEEINTSGRTELGFLALINSAVANHKHNGATGNPDPIDLSKEVQGILGQQHLPDLDASLIQAGTIDTDRLPKIDHIEKLTNQGLLTHSQLDSYVETLSLENQSLMGEVSTVNLLQLILALKHVYPDIDEFLVNQIAFIPGISPNDYIDTINTTAIVDTRSYSEGGQHTITGVPSESFKAFTKKWEKNNDFKNGTLSNTIVNGDSVVLNTTEDELSIEEFNNITGWQVSTHDLSSIGANLQLDSEKYISEPYSAKLTIGSEAVEVQLLLQKTFTSQDWSEYDFLNFYIYTSNVQHGDLFFYIRDTVYGEQNSSVKILNRNAITINDDTLVNGWQEVIIDLRQFNRSKIDSMGFYVSTQDGWDTSKGFDFNIDSFSLNAGNIYEQDGYIRLIYGNSIYQNFWRLRWDATYPSDDLSSGISLQGRTRVANNLVDLSTSPWSSYSSVSGYQIELPSESLYKYIEVEMYFIAATSLKRSVILNSLYLDYYIVDVENSFDFSTKDDWESGSRFSIDIDSNPGSISISGSEYFGDVIYGTDGAVNISNANSNGLFRISGSMLPVSVHQSMNSLPSGFGMITGVSKGADGNIWLSDIDNDRVVEIDRRGNMVRGFYGSFLADPLTQEEVVEIEDSTVNVLSGVYNKSKNILYVILDKKVSISQVPYMYLKIASYKVYLLNYIIGGGVSNVVKFHINGSDATLIDVLADIDPSVCIYSPSQNSIVSDRVEVRFLINNHDISNGVGVQIDGGSFTTIYSKFISYDNLAVGLHSVVIRLKDSNGDFLTNERSTATIYFVVENNYKFPQITIVNPSPNQMYAGNVVSVDFRVINFPILSSGQHLMYRVDMMSSFHHYSSDPIILSGLSHGIHVFYIWMVDEYGDEIEYDYNSTNVSFFIGANNAIMNLHSSNNAHVGNIVKITNIDVGDVTYMQLYSPIDVQFLPPSDGKSEPTVLISKLY
jgi:hypothetical protein